MATARARAGELDLAEAAALAPGEVLSRLGSGTGGLSSADAEQRLRRFGPNTLATHRVRPFAVLFRQVRNPILILLLGAALVSALTGGGTNALIIAVIVALSVGLGFFNEYRAEIAMAALRAQIRQEAEVRRDDRVSRVPVLSLVPGDRVSLRIGALVPADLRLLEVDELECDEGVLTGESMPVPKSAAPVAGRQPQDQPGCAFMGTIVHQGSGLGVVVATGTGTAFGQIAAGLAEKPSQTAFEAGLSRFSRFLFAVAAVLTAFHERQLASVLATDPGGRSLMITKGAPEVVLDRCTHVPDGARTALETLFRDGARVVARGQPPGGGRAAADRRGDWSAASGAGRPASSTIRRRAETPVADGLARGQNLP